MGQPGLREGGEGLQKQAGVGAFMAESKPAKRGRAGPPPCALSLGSPVKGRSGPRTGTVRPSSPRSRQDLP